MTDEATAKANREAADVELTRRQRILNAVRLADAIEAAMATQSVRLAIKLPQGSAETLVDTIGLPSDAIWSFEETVLTEIVSRIRTWEASQ